MDLRWPAAAAFPPVIGGYPIDGIRHQLTAGTVYASTAPSGTPVVVVQLHGGAATDGAALDRFDQSVTELARKHPELVVDLAGLRLLPPWVALTDAAAEQAPTLLDAAVPRDADQTPRAGPRFRLPWFRRWWPAGRAPWSGTKAPPRWRRLWWLVGVIALMALLGLLLSMCAPPPQPSDGDPTPGPRGPSAPASESPGDRQQPGQGDQNDSGDPDQPGEGDDEGSERDRRV